MEKKHSYVIRLIAQDEKGRPGAKYFTGINRNLGIFGQEAHFTRHIEQALVFFDYQEALKKRPGFRWQVVELGKARAQHSAFNLSQKN